MRGFIKSSFLAVLILVLFLLEVPLKVLFIITLLNLVLKENFPFSHFPMYSKPSKVSTYVFLADEADRAIPVQRKLGFDSPFLEGVLEGFYVALLRTAQQRSFWKATPLELKPAGISTLVFLKELLSRMPQAGRHQKLRLYQVKLSIEGKSIQREQILIAEL